MIKKNIYYCYKKFVKLLSGSNVSKIPFVLSLHDFIISSVKPQFIFFEGNKIYLDKKDTLGLSINGVYEEFETEIIKNTIKKGDVVIDLGANIGYYTVLFAKLVGPTGKVYAFEPDPSNFSILKKNITINKYKNVIPINKAVSDKNGILKLFLANSKKGAHSTLINYTNRKNHIDVETITLNKYFENYSKQINFIKMDIEGAEFLALKGMSKILKKNDNLKLISEFSPFMINKLGGDYREYINLLYKNNFEVYEISELSKKLNLTKREEILSKCTLNREYIKNLFCVKNNKNKDALGL